MADRDSIKSLNKETGELHDLSLWFSEQIPTDGSVRFSGLVKEDTDYNDIQIYTVPDGIKEEDEQEMTYEHPFWGTMIRMKEDKRYFTMEYHNEEEATFSTDTFYKHWYRLTRRLDWNSNILIHKRPKIHPVQTMKEIQTFLCISKPTVYKFIKECKDKGYIAKTEFLSITFWVVNPRYFRSGRDMPIRLMDLFQFGQDYVNGNLPPSDEE